MKAVTFKNGSRILVRDAKPGERRLVGCGSAYRIEAKAEHQKAVTLEPTEDRLLVRPIEVDQTTTGGIVVPDTAKDKPRKGLVLAVGPGVRLETGAFVPPVIRAGETVWFERYAGGELTINGEELRLIREADVAARER